MNSEISVGSVPIERFHFLEYLDFHRDFLSKQIQILFQMNFSRRQGSPQAFMETQC